MDEGLHYYLDFSICKAVGEEDTNGNYTFQVEASNESVDLQDQIVLQSALMKSKDNFLKYGVISYDHLHRKKDENGEMISDASMIIGEPTEVWTEGKKTFVKGILYKTNDMAREVIKLLKAGSTRIRASVGGLFPKIVRDPLTGIEKITSVLWNDLALTPCPVNNTVSAATFAKSLTVAEFAKKALESGYETDSGNKKNGQSLTTEDLDKKTIKTYPETEELEEDEIIEIAKSFFEKKSRKEFGDSNEAKCYLRHCGLNEKQAHEFVQKIYFGGDKMGMGIFTKSVDELLKSMKKAEEKEEFDFREDDEDEDLDINIEVDEDNEDEEDEEYEDFEEESVKKGCKKSVKKACKKSDDEDEEMEEEIDATEIIKSLAFELKKSNKKTMELEKSIDDLGNAIVEVAKMVKTQSEITKSISEVELPMQSIMSKSHNSNGFSTKITKADFDNAKDVLVKAVADGEISLQKSIAIEHDIQVAMQSGKPMKDEHFNFIKNKLSR